MSQQTNEQFFVVFDYFGRIAITTKENYESQIRNEKLINKFPHGITADEAINTFTEYGIAERSQFIKKV